MKMTEKSNMDADVQDNTSLKTETKDQPVELVGGNVFVAKEDSVFVDERVESYGDKPDFSSQTPMEVEGPIDSRFLDEEIEPGKTRIGKTPNGKSVQVYKLPDRNGYGIQFSEGGEQPKEFRGMWTSYSKAELDARLYLQKRWDEYELNGTASAG